MRQQACKTVCVSILTRLFTDSCSISSAQSSLNDTSSTDLLASRKLPSGVSVTEALILCPPLSSP